MQKWYFVSRHSFAVYFSVKDKGLGTECNGSSIYENLCNVGVCGVCWCNCGWQAGNEELRREA